MYSRFFSAGRRPYIYIETPPPSGAVDYLFDPFYDRTQTNRVCPCALLIRYMKCVQKRLKKRIVRAESVIMFALSRISKSLRLLRRLQGWLQLTTVAYNWAFLLWSTMIFLPCKKGACLRGIYPWNTACFSRLDCIAQNPHALVLEYHPHTLFIYKKLPDSSSLKIYEEN